MEMWDFPIFDFRNKVFFLLLSFAGDLPTRRGLRYAAGRVSDMTYVTTAALSAAP
jgi:hypothetical protein